MQRHMELLQACNSIMWSVYYIIMCLYPSLSLSLFLSITQSLYLSLLICTSSLSLSLSLSPSFNLSLSISLSLSLSYSVFFNSSLPPSLPPSLPRNNVTYPKLGPPLERSKTCLGFSSHWNCLMSLAPWLPPLLGLMKTSRGLLSLCVKGLICRCEQTYAHCKCVHVCNTPYLRTCLCFLVQSAQG